MLRTTIQRKAAAPVNPAHVPRFASRPFAPPASAGKPLPAGVRAPMEAALGHDFASVRIHADDASAPRIGALAYARGEHLHFAPGAWRPGSAGGRAMLGHELAHVVQQRQGRVRPSRAGGIHVNDSPALEREADTHGARASQGSAAHEAPRPTPASAGAQAASAAVVQMIPTWKKALYGVGGLLGGAALVGGAIAASPAIALGGAAVAGTSALLAHRERAAEKDLAARTEPGIQARAEAEKAWRKNQRETQGKKLARTGDQRTHNDLKDLRYLQRELGRSGENPLLHKVLKETLGKANMRGTRVSGGSGTAHGETGRGAEEGTHVVRLDDLETDSTRRQSFLLHELTHVAADRKYSLNRVEGQQFANTPYVGANDDEAGGFVANRRREIETSVGRAKTDVWKDKSLKQADREYVHDRLHYISSMPGVEYDTVANELLLYAHHKKFPADSPTVKHIHALAEDAYRRRNGTYARTGNL